MSRSWNNFKLEVADVIVLDKIKVVVSRIDNNIPPYHHDVEDQTNYGRDSLTSLSRLLRHRQAGGYKLDGQLQRS